MNERPIRATKKAPCAICGRGDWCGVSSDGLIAFCMRISDGSEGTAKNGAYIHRLGPQPGPARKPPATAQPAPKQATLAPIERRDAVFTSLLDALSLSQEHGNQLLARGLSDIEIARQRYATAPTSDAASRLTRDLAQRFDLSGAPGFYRESGKWCLVSLSAGLLIPVRDEKGRIQALRSRLDDAGNGKRYIWVSSAWKLGGVSPGAPMHWARPWRINSTRKLVLTEGELKSEVTAEILDEAVLSLPGVTSFSPTIGQDLKRLFPMLERVAIAFDADFATNPRVLNSLLRLGRILRTEGLAVSVLKWPEIAGVRVKGIDDFLIARCQ